MPDKSPAAKRRRTSKSEMARYHTHDAADIAKALRRYTLVLELVESNEPAKHPQLLKGLFHALSELQHFRALSDSSLVYIQGLVVGSLLSVVERLADANNVPADNSIIRVDLLVDCIRSTPSPQVYNTALLLVSSLVSWVPELVLHSVMPIFTFMGSTILRQSDDYSAHVVDQTISRIVPALAESLRKHGRGTANKGTSELLSSFATTYEHVPSHRRLALFEHLVKAIGAVEALPALVAMLIHKYPDDNGISQFALNLMRLFGAQTELAVHSEYIRLLLDLAGSKEKRASSIAIFGLSGEKSQSDVDRIMENQLDTFSEILDDQQLRHRLAKSVYGDSETSTQQRLQFTTLMERSIQLTSILNKQSGSYESGREVMERVFKLLPLNDLLGSATPLLEDDPSNEAGEKDSNVPTALIKSLITQTQRVKSNDVNSGTALLSLLPKLTTMLQSTEDAGLRIDIVQLIDEVSERFGKKDLPAVSAAASAIAGERAFGSTDIALQTSSLLALSSLIQVLRDEFVGLIPTIMPQAIGHLRSATQDGKNEEDMEGPSQNERLHNACFTFFTSILEHIPYIMSGNYVDEIMMNFQQSRSIEWTVASSEAVTEFYEFLSNRLGTAECFSAIERNVQSSFLTDDIVRITHFPKY